MKIDECPYCHVIIVPRKIPRVNQMVLCNGCWQVLRFDGERFLALTQQEEENMPDGIRDYISDAQWKKDGGESIGPSQDEGDL